MGTYILADNQELTRLAFETLIRQGQQTVRHASDKVGLALLLQDEPESIVILDYTLFDFVDSEQLLIAGDRFPHSRWLLVSDELTHDFLRRVAYASNQFSIVFKGDSLGEIRQALQATAQGKRFLSQRVMELVLTQQLQEETKTELLTATETEILRNIAQGKTSKEIARERFSSIHTINTHKKNIFRKLKVNTAHEAIKYALRAGLVEPAEFYI